MRVPAPNCSDRPESGSGEMPENGRSRRKRVPKTCDCCGPNCKPHVAGHDQITKKRGRKKKEMVNHENVATEEEVASSEMELVTLDADTATVSEMEEEASPKRNTDVSQTEGKIVSEVNEASVMVNGTEKSPQTDTNCLDPHLCASTHTKELSSTEQDHFKTSATVDSSDVLVGSARRSDSQKNPESQPGVSAQSDAMETEPTSLSANISNSVFWDHPYCWPLPGESKNSCPEVTGDPSALTPAEITTEGIIEVIHEFLEQFYEKYGSFTPLIDTDVLDHLNKTFQSDLSDRMKLVTAEVAKYKAGLACAPMHFFQVTYNKHTLTLDDLSTLDDQNWVNDQVINMYGELIMEATSHKVHFFNSFFYRQFVAKGYEGVKRWTKKVDLFSKKLILIPLHLEIHWSLIAVDVSKQNINFYDSQGILFKFAVDHVLKYILAEAKEKKQLAFQKGWKMVINKTIPQQKNDNDCGVFVLEYCKCLTFLKPLLFTQEDMPRVRKRIYRELCDRRLSDCSNQDKAT
ncbi:sentrin-specific protease 5 isoform X1 [Triplophysa rosa]|uniref:Sentrin-specific protease 5 n=1 Tax=Triplophysa rosa TaxID=992332 RepID=A0A9W7W8Q5_TRIRA|nr:sentrin-specific protease 5 isoform X1 [Triplophysa rosa]KAI7791582.1 sentrin-specific protease 5 [Triplophysa rosa]